MGSPTRRIAALCAAASLLLAGLVGAPASHAAGGNPILNDCQVHGELTHSYSIAQLREALATLPAALQQYGNCHDVLQTAIIRAQKGEPIGAISGGGGSFLPLPVIIALAVLVVCALVFTALALRARRRSGPPPPPAAGRPRSPSPGSPAPPPPE